MSFNCIFVNVSPRYSTRTVTNQGFESLNLKHAGRTSDTVTVPSPRLQQRAASSEALSYLCLECGVRVDECPEICPKAVLLLVRGEKDGN